MSSAQVRARARATRTCGLAERGTCGRAAPRALKLGRHSRAFRDESAQRQRLVRRRRPPMNTLERRQRDTVLRVAAALSAAECDVIFVVLVVAVAVGVGVLIAAPETERRVHGIDAHAVPTARPRRMASARELILEHLDARLRVGKLLGEHVARVV